MGEILLTQAVTVVYRITYSREQVIELLTAAGAEADSLATMPDKELGEVLVATAADIDDTSGLYERITDDAGQWQDAVDAGDWELTEVRP